MFREYGKEMSRIEKGPASVLGKKDLDVAERAVKFVETASRAEIARAVAASGGPDSSFMVSIKAGLYQKILNEANIVNEHGVRQLSPKIVNEQIEKLRGKFEGVMSEADWERLTDFQVYAAVLSQSMDAGGMIQAGAAVGNLTAFLNPIRMLRAVHTLGTNALTGRILASPVSYEQIRSQAGSGFNFKHLRAFADAAFVASQQGQDDQRLFSDPFEPASLSNTDLSGAELQGPGSSSLVASPPANFTPDQPPQPGSPLTLQDLANKLN